MDGVTALASSISLLAIMFPVGCSIWRARVNGSKLDITQYVQDKADLDKRLEGIHVQLQTLTILVARLVNDK